MRFFEYEARKIVELAGIPVTHYGFCKSAEEARAVAAEIGGPVVIKSQVLSGGRMKAGGVKFADTPEEAAEHAAAILGLEINGHMPRGVLVDPKAEVKQEYYAGVVWDGDPQSAPLMLFSDMGGIDIEEVADSHPDHVGRGHLSNLLPISDFQAKQAIAATGVSGTQLNRATPILARLARLFRRLRHDPRRDQPAGRARSDGSFVALDAHMEMENEALGRQKALLARARSRRRGDPRGPRADAVRARRRGGRRRRITAAWPGNVTEFDGNLGLVIGAGGGSLTLFDAVRAHGGEPANYCEIGGNPSVRKACGLAKLVLQKPGVDKIAVMMSIVSNTRVDIVARGVIKACLELGYDPAEKIAIFRIPGAWEEEGFKILERTASSTRTARSRCTRRPRRAVEKIQGAAA